MKKLLIILLSIFSLTAFAQTNVKRVAILETVDKLENVPYLKKLMFRSNLTTAITNTDGYEGYDRVDLAKITGEQNFQRTGLVSDADIKKIGEFTGAQYVLVAEATIDGEDLFITAKIIDVETARVMRNSNQLMGTSATEMQMGSQKVAADLLRTSSGSTTHQKTDANTTVSAYQSSSKSAPIKTSSISMSTVSPSYASTNFSAEGYVDLGLPSGTLWKSTNEDCGLINYDQALSSYTNKIPTKEQWEELKNSCTWKYNGNGFVIIGPNNNSIFLSASGRQGCSGNIYDVNVIGSYWSSSSYDKERIWYVAFGSSGASMYISGHCDGRSIRLVKKR